jgi:hypothetical protein
VQVPRFRIAWLMVFVAIAALNLGAIRALLGIRSPLNNKAVGVLGLGALPMVNLLAAGTIAGRCHPTSRTFLWGFEVSGAAALVLYVAGACLFSEQLLMSYLYLVVWPVTSLIEQNRLVVQIPIVYLTAVFMLALPQVTFALIGAFLFRKFKIAE